MSKSTFQQFTNGQKVKVFGRIWEIICLHGWRVGTGNYDEPEYAIKTDGTSTVAGSSELKSIVD
jgi:hypothetical protein